MINEVTEFVGYIPPILKSVALAETNNDLAEGEHNYINIILSCARVLNVKNT